MAPPAENGQASGMTGMSGIMAPVYSGNGPAEGLLQPPAAAPSGIDWWDLLCYQIAQCTVGHDTRRERPLTSTETRVQGVMGLSDAFGDRE